MTSPPDPLSFQERGGRTGRGTCAPLKRPQEELKRGFASLFTFSPSLFKGLASNVILRNEVTKNLWVGLAVHR